MRSPIDSSARVCDNFVYFSTSIRNELFGARARTATRQTSDEGQTYTPTMYALLLSVVAVLCWHTLACLLVCLLVCCCEIRSNRKGRMKHFLFVTGSRLYGFRKIMPPSPCSKIDRLILCWSHFNFDFAPPTFDEFLKCAVCSALNGSSQQSCIK